MYIELLHIVKRTWIRIVIYDLEMEVKTMICIDRKLNST